MIAWTWNFCSSFIYDIIRCHEKTTENEVEKGSSINKALVTSNMARKSVEKEVSFAES